MFKEILHFKGHLEINFIIYMFLDFLNSSKDENSFLMKIETITSIFNYLREKRIFIHFSCKFYREFRYLNFIRIFNLLDSKIQDQFIYYLVETNSNVDCEFCDSEAHTHRMARPHGWSVAGGRIIATVAEGVCPCSLKR